MMLKYVAQSSPIKQARHLHFGPVLRWNCVIEC